MHAPKLHQLYLKSGVFLLFCLFWIFNVARKPLGPNGVSSSHFTKIPAITIQLLHTQLSLQKRINFSNMLRLTCGMFGLQLIWSTIMVNGTPFLLSLGLSQHLTSLVWLASPLCGAIVQPIVGAHSDRCRYRWGKRKPYIVGGTVATTTSLLGLAYCSTMIPSLARLLKAPLSDSASATLTKLTAVIWVYILNVSIQPLQFGIRALIVEQAPVEMQPSVNAWASRFSSLGNVFMCAIGIIDVSKWWPITGDRFHSLVIIAAVVLTFTVGITCLTVHEHSTLLYPGHERHHDQRSIFASLIDATKKMPDLSLNVCRVQFVSWLGWFPVLYYSSSYVGDFYLSWMTGGRSSLAKAKHDELWHEAVGLGNLSVLISSLVTLLVLVIIPLFIAKVPPNDRQEALGRLWASSQIVFGISITITIFVNNYLGAIMVLAMSGASWAVTIWVPFALIGRDLARLNDNAAFDGLDISTNRDGSGVEHQVGGIVGLHNLAISVPQMLSTLIVSLLFLVLSYFEVEDAVGWVLRASALTGFIAAYMIVRLEI